MTLSISILLLALTLYFFRKAIIGGVRRDESESRLKTYVESQNKSDKIDVDISNNRSILKQWMSKKKSASKAPTSE